MRQQLLAIAIAATAATSAQAQDSYMGQILQFAFAFCPQGTLPAQGQLLQISQSTALFSLLGTTYGGDGQTT